MWARTPAHSRYSRAILIDLIAGIDWSTKQIDVSLIPLDPSTKYLLFRTAWLPKTERERAAGKCVERLLLPDSEWEGVTATDAGKLHVHPIRSVWLEEPWGPHRNTDRILLPLYGAMLSHIEQPCGTMSAREWRAALGVSPNSKKEDMIAEAIRLRDAFSMPARGFTEHQAEAFLLAVVGRDLIWRNA